MKTPFQKIQIVMLKCLLYIWIVGLYQNSALSQEFHGSVSPPGFIGGNKALKEFIYKNLVLPDSIKEAGISGTVMVSLVIKSDGTKGKVNLVHGIDPVCDSEALRIVSLLSEWKPALNWGKPVDCKILLPIRFTSDKTSKKVPFMISGTVMSKSTGRPLEGTLVLIKGTNSGTITDMNGQYKIEIPREDCEIEFSSMGFEPVTEPVGQNRTLNVELNEGYFIVNLNSEN